MVDAIAPYAHDVYSVSEMGDKWVATLFSKELAEAFVVWAQPAMIPGVTLEVREL